jgi:predicted signal transduction protein with EAL and GGDEF domain
VIVRSVIDLGHNLGLSIVAEGVETQAGLDCLTGYGCDVVQGYFISRPMAVEAFDHWRDTWVGLPGPAGRAVPELLPAPRAGITGRVPQS